MEQRGDVAGLPGSVISEFERYLACGDGGLTPSGAFAGHPRPSFAQMHCTSCGHETLVAFSCKGRGSCPSCAACTGPRSTCSSACCPTWLRANGCCPCRAGLATFSPGARPHHPRARHFPAGDPGAPRLFCHRAAHRARADSHCGRRRSLAGRSARVLAIVALTAARTGLAGWNSLRRRRSQGNGVGLIRPSPHRRLLLPERRPFQRGGNHSISLKGNMRLPAAEDIPRATTSAGSVAGEEP